MKFHQLCSFKQNEERSRISLKCPRVVITTTIKHTSRATQKCLIHYFSLQLAGFNTLIKHLNTAYEYATWRGWKLPPQSTSEFQDVGAHESPYEHLHKVYARLKSRHLKKLIRWSQKHRIDWTSRCRLMNKKDRYVMKHWSQEIIILDSYSNGLMLLWKDDIHLE